MSGSWRYALKMFTAPNWLARMRMLSTRLYPDALKGGGQFSEWDLASEELAIAVESNRSPRRCLRVHMKTWWKGEAD